jgi:hypothetical protein
LWRELARYLPGNRILHVEQLWQRAVAAHLGREPQLSHVHELRSSGEGLAIEVVVPHQHVIDVHLVGNAEQGRARRPDCERNSKAVECGNAIFTAYHVNLWRGKTLAQNFWESFSNPLDPRHFGRVLKRKNDEGVSCRALQLRLNLYEWEQQTYQKQP